VITKQPEALRLAHEYYEDHWIVGTKTWCREAVEELRRLHQSESEGWRYANELEQERKLLHEVNVELLEAVKYIANCCQLSLDNPKFRIDETACDLIRVAIAKATGGNA
jgi:hypothetical protein